MYKCGPTWTADQQLRSDLVPRQPERGPVPRELHNRGRSQDVKMSVLKLPNVLTSSMDETIDARQRT